MGRSVSVGLIQTTASESVEDNVKRTAGLIRQAAARGAQIVCTQELFKSRYFCQTMDISQFRLAERVDDQNPTVQELSQLARDLEIVIIASLFEKRAPGLYHNTAAVIDADGRFLGKYRKMHIPDDPLYLEKYYFAPGDLGYPVFQTRHADIGVLICWDQWFPEAARLTAMKGAEIVFYPTAIGYGQGERERMGTTSRDAWQVVQRGHAVANGCFVATVNRVGFEATPGGASGIDFWGHSFVSDPYGRVVAQAATDHQEILVCPVDLDLVEEARNYLALFFRDRRIDSYGGLSQRFLR